MSPEFWFGVTLTFKCTACKRASEERLAISSSQPDNLPAIKKQIDVEIGKGLRCQRCRYRVPIGQDISVEIQPGGVERLKKLGFPVV